MLVELNKHNQYLWDLSYDVHGFWDRFLDGIAERGETIPHRIGLYEWNEWLRGAADYPTHFIPWERARSI
jgi:hypothetical protein